MCLAHSLLSFAIPGSIPGGRGLDNAVLIALASHLCGPGFDIRRRRMGENLVAHPVLVVFWDTPVSCNYNDYITLMTISFHELSVQSKINTVDIDSD